MELYCTRGAEGYYHFPCRTHLRTFLLYFGSFPQRLFSSSSLQASARKQFRFPRKIAPGDDIVLTVVPFCSTRSTEFHFLWDGDSRKKFRSISFVLLFSFLFHFLYFCFSPQCFRVVNSSCRENGKASSVENSNPRPVTFLSTGLDFALFACFFIAPTVA